MCQKCAKFTSEPKHRRLNISKQPCRRSQLSEEFWTVVPSQKKHCPYLIDLFVNVSSLGSAHNLAWSFSRCR